MWKKAIQHLRLAGFPPGLGLTSVLASGGIVDLVRALQCDVLLAYGLVFIFEAVLLLLALRLLNRVNIREARVLSESMEPAD